MGTSGRLIRLPQETTRRLAALVESHQGTDLDNDRIERIRLAAESLLAIDMRSDEYCVEMGLNDAGILKVLCFRAVREDARIPKHRFEKRAGAYVCTGCGAAPWEAAEGVCSAFSRAPWRTP